MLAFPAMLFGVEWAVSNPNDKILWESGAGCWDGWGFLLHPAVNSVVPTLWLPPSPVLCLPEGKVLPSDSCSAVVLGYLG